MKTETIYEDIRYTLSNENLTVLDKVYPIARGRCVNNNEFILHNFDFRDFMSGFPNEPHIIKDLNYSTSKSEEVRTDCGYSPKECYFKIIKMEKHIKKPGQFFNTYEWIEIPIEI
jgi:hypothetical protein